MLLVLFACVWMSDADLALLRDADGDGAPVWEDCDDADATIGAADLHYADEDGDGVGGLEQVGCDGVAEGGDCDDADATVGGPIAWYGDGDGDGLIGATATLACEEPVGIWATTPGHDCDDADPAIGVAAYRYVDVDGDGYGGDDLGPGCPEAGTSFQAGDCDDSDPGAYPGAPPDTCAGTDANCDGDPDADIDFRDVSLGGPDNDGTTGDTAPEGLGSALAYGVIEGAGQVIAAGSPAETLIFAVDPERGDGVYTQTRGDRFAAIDTLGDSIAIGKMFVDLDDPGDIAVGDADWNGTGVVAILDIPSAGGDYGFEAASASWTGATGDRAGADLAFVEGVPGAISSVLYVGGPGADDGRGAAWILSLGGMGESREAMLEDAGYRISAADGDTDLALGSMVGTWFQDGAAYAVVAAPGWDASARPDAGAVFVAGYGASDVTRDAVATWVGPRSGSRAASAVAHEDLDGDGHEELIVGVEGAAWGGNDGAGAVYVVDGTDVLTGGELADAGLVLGGEVAARGFGREVLVYHPTDGPPTLLVSSHDDRGCGDFGAVWRWRPDVDGARGSFTMSDAYYRVQGELGSELGATLAEGGGYVGGEPIDWVWAGAPAEARVAAFAFTAER